VAAMLQAILLDVQQLQLENRRVSFAPPVHVKRLHYAQQSFYAQSSCPLAQLIFQSIQHFGITGDCQDPRFYHIPSTEGGGILLRTTIRSEVDWRSFVDERIREGSAPHPIVVQFVCVDTSPPPTAPDSPPTPPRVPPDVGNSEQQSNSTVNNRDGHKCVVCQETNCVELAHIIDKKRIEMAQGILDDIDSAVNVITLCPTHHAHFDNFVFTLVPINDAPDCRDFRITPVSAPLMGNWPPSLTMYETIHFHDDSAPLPHLFLFKCLLRFRLKCTRCDQSCQPHGYKQHFRTHVVDDCQLPLPSPCKCGQQFTDPKSLYEHMTQNHLDLLYYTGTSTG
jgi:HNH endonuclease